MTRTAITILFILTIHNLYSCNCRTKKELDSARQLEYVNSEIIILGEVIFVSSDQNSFKIKVLESYKGELLAHQVIEGENHEYGFPNVYYTGHWFIYRYFENGTFKTNICGLSRSLKFPEKSRYFWALPPPPPPLYPKDSVQYNELLKKRELLVNEYDIRARKEVYNEIELLRKKASVQQ